MHLANIFLFYSIFGNIIERIFMFFIDKSYVSGFMGSIFTPIYGIAAIIILFVHKHINIKNIFLKTIVEFISFFILLSILEFIGGWLIENIFNKVFWNYDNMKYNIGIYTSLEVGLIWGILSLVFIYLIHPIFLKLEKKMPKFLTIIVGIIFLINLFYIILVK